MIPYIFGMASMFTTLKDQANNPSDSYSYISIMMTIVMVISLLASYILNNLILINQGMVYYSQRDYDENISSNSSIDLIGTDSE